MGARDDDAARMAVLRHVLIEAFMAGDDAAWISAIAELTRILRARPRRVDRRCKRLNPRPDLPRRGE